MTDFSIWPLLFSVAHGHYNSLNTFRYGPDQRSNHFGGVKWSEHPSIHFTLSLRCHEGLPAQLGDFHSGCSDGRSTNALYAPLGKPIKLEVKSVDVIHGFFIPAFRLKIDALPGRATTTWFEATQLGSYDLQCTVICGVQHAVMLAKVVVVPEEEFKAWYFGPEGTPEPGKQYLLHGQNTPVNVKT